MLIQPLHIATRGRLDGEYGIATRGYIVLPDIVPRFPQRAEVDQVGWLPVPGAVEELEFQARIEDHGVFTLQADVAEVPGLEAIANGDTERLIATAADGDWEGVVEEIPDLFAAVSEAGFDGAVAPDGDLGEVDDAGPSAVPTGDGLIGDVDENEPPGC